MKKHFLRLPHMAIIGALVIFLFTGCEKILPEKINFEVDQNVALFLQPMPPVGEVTLSNPQFSIDLDSALKAQGVDNYKVSGIKPKSIYLETITPDANFDAFKSINTYLSTTTLPQVEMAGQNNIPKGLKKVNLDVIDMNIMEYIQEPPTTFTVKANLSDSIRKAMDVKVFMKFNIEVTKN